MEEIIIGYKEFEKANIKAISFELSLTMLKCNCILENTHCYGLLDGDASLPLKMRSVYPPLIAYTAHIVHLCPETNEYVAILIKSQSRVFKLKTTPILEMECLGPQWIPHFHFLTF